jgi:tetratricopeptide (TPR) repeat protein
MHPRAQQPQRLRYVVFCCPLLFLHRLLGKDYFANFIGFKMTFAIAKACRIMNRRDVIILDRESPFARGFGLAQIAAVVSCAKTVLPQIDLRHGDAPGDTMRNSLRPKKLLPFRRWSFRRWSESSCGQRILPKPRANELNKRANEKDCKMLKMTAPRRNQRSEFTVIHAGLSSWTAFLALLIVVCCGSSVRSQSRPMPNPEYYQTPFVNFYQGDYRQAIRNFISVERSAFKIGDQRYLDSICYWTMIGECHFQVGNYNDAITFYERAIDLYLSYLKQKWQSRIQAIPNIAPDTTAIERTRVNWGSSGRVFIIPRMPSSISVMFGDLDAERRLREGGMVQNAELRSIDLSEIMRCTALAIYRRSYILGPTSKFSQASNQIVAGLKGAPRQPGLFGAYNGVLLGLAQASVDDWDAAAGTLGASLQFNNGMDHPLTPLALLQLAQIGVATEDFDSARKFAMEASYSGAFFRQFDVIDDGLSLASQLHLMNNSTPFNPLPLALEWARREKAHRLHTSLAIRMAESFSEMGQVEQGALALSQADSANARGPLSTSQLGARVAYIRALNLFQQGNFSAGLTELDAAIKLYRPSSLWIYRLALTDTLAAAAGIGERQADLLYGSMLRDPNATDWQKDPLEAITFLATEHLVPLERWFEVAILRGDHERALEIAELTRRHRFFSQMPFGGRSLAFRWLLHSPIEWLSGTAQQQRRDFLVKYPKYQTLINRTEQIHTALSLLPVMPEPKSDQFREQARLFKELSEISEEQEAFLANCGLRRIPAEMSFPPQYALSEFRGKLAEDQAAWVCFGTALGYHRFLVRSNQVKYLGILKDRDVQNPIRAVLKKIGSGETSIEVSLLQSDDWKATVQEAADKLLAGTSLDDLTKLRELVIVPDGLVWYFPFEAIQVGTGEKAENLIDKLDIRYSPTLFLAYDGHARKRELKNRAVQVAKPHPKGELSVTETAFQELAIKLPKLINIESLSKQTRPEMVATQLDQVLVWNEIQVGKTPTLDVAPMQVSTTTPLRNWMLLPWRAPDEFLFPAFQSDAGNGLRGKKKGTDLFLFSLGMMGSGTRSLLLSRWRTGGTNSLTFSKYYLERQLTMSNAQAFRESLIAARKLELNYTTEPQIRTKKDDPVLNAQHPYFWSGYLRIEIPYADDSQADVLLNNSSAEPEDARQEDAAGKAKEPPGKEPPGKAGDEDGKPAAGNASPKDGTT